MIEVSSGPLNASTAAGGWGSGAAMLTLIGAASAVAVGRTEDKEDPSPQISAVGFHTGALITYQELDCKVALGDVGLKSLAVAFELTLAQGGGPTLPS